MAIFVNQTGVHFKSNDFLRNNLMKHILMILCATALVVGCGSAVKLDTVAVEDKAGTAVLPQGLESTGNVVGKGGVTSVDVGNSTQQGIIPTGQRVVYF